MEEAPHHGTLWGARWQTVFFSDDDHGADKDLLAEGCRAAGMEISAYGAP
jgi:hypothetical protein